MALADDLADLREELKKGLAEIDKRIVALGERVVALENAPVPAAVAESDDWRAVVSETLNSLHMQLFGVPAGKLQSLTDEPKQD